MNRAALIEKTSRAAIKKAARLLSEGRLVAFPTETVYGLGADALSPDAVAGIFTAKGRPQDNPLIVHVASVEDAENIAFVDARARALMKSFWPGPLTLVLPARESVPLVTRGGLDTVALRMPLHPTALALIKACGFPLAAPSANKSGRPSPTTAQAVFDDLAGRIDMILDSGPADVGLESTVLDTTGKYLTILRPGGVTCEDLLAAGFQITQPAEGRAESLRRSPGTRYRHYAPAVPVVLWSKGSNVNVTGRRWGFIGINIPELTPDKKILFMSPADYAHGLFAAMRELESSGIDLIVAELPDDSGIGGALRNRLIKAAGETEE